MLQRRNNYWLSAVFTTIFLMGLFRTSLLAQHKQELVVIIEPVSSSDKLIHFAKRKHSEPR